MIPYLRTPHLGLVVQNRKGQIVTPANSFCRFSATEQDIVFILGDIFNIRQKTICICMQLNKFSTEKCGTVLKWCLIHTKMDTGLNLCLSRTKNVNARTHTHTYTLYVIKKRIDVNESLKHLLQLTP